MKNSRTRIEFIQRKSWPGRILRGKFRLRQRSQVNQIIGQFIVEDRNPAIFMKEISMCNLVGAQVVHRSNGMINSEHFHKLFFIHHGPLLPVMGPNGCSMSHNFPEAPCPHESPLSPSPSAPLPHQRLNPPLERHARACGHACLRSIPP